MRDSRCFYSDPAHQLSEVRDIPAPFPGLRGHSICFLCNRVLVYLDTKCTAELS